MAKGVIVAEGEEKKRKRGGGEHTKFLAKMLGIKAEIVRRVAVENFILKLSNESRNG